MKKLIMLFFALVISLVAQAQDINISRGPEYVDDPGTNIADILGDDGTGILMLRMGKNDYYIEKYNYDMVKVFSSKIVLPAAGKKEYEMEQVLLVNSRVYLFASFYEKDALTNTLYGVVIGEDGQMVGDVKELAILPGKNKGHSGTFDVSLSEDSTKILIVKHEDSGKQEGEKVGLKVINTDLTKLWEKDFGLDYKQKNYDLKTAKVDKSGNVHMIAKIYIPAKERVKGGPIYNYEVFSYYHSYGELKLYTVDLGDNYINDVDIRVNENDVLVGAGFYSEKSTYSLKGAFYFTIDPEIRAVKKVSYKAFTAEFLMNFMSAAKVEKGTELANYVIREIYTKPDGGAVLVAEYYLYTETTTHTYTNGIITKTTTTYRWLYNDVIAADVSASGEIQSYSCVPKKQMFRYSTTNNVYGGGVGFVYSNRRPLAYLGIATMFVNGKLNIVYNENPKNLLISGTNKGMKVMDNPKGSITTLATVDENGIVTRLPLFTARDKENNEKAIVKPRYHVNTSENTMILFCEFGTKYKFIKLEF